MIELSNKQLEITHQALVEKFESSTDYELKVEIIEIIALINEAKLTSELEVAEIPQFEGTLNQLNDWL